MVVVEASHPCQSLFLADCSLNPRVSSSSKSQRLLHVIPCLSSSSYSKSNKWISFKAVQSVLHKSSSKREDYSNVGHVLEDSSSDWNISSSGIKRKRLAVFVSGGGSNFRSIHEASIQKLVHGDVSVLVTNKSDCGGANYAKEMGIPIALFPKTKDSPDGLSPGDLVALLRKFEVDFILLAGYLKKIPDELVQAYPRSILNIHPSLLPAFGGKGYYGKKVHKAVIASGARYSGPTIHFVDEHYDTGIILAQRVVPVLANDSAEELATRVLHEVVEHVLYVEVVTALCEDRVVWRQDGVPLIQSKTNPDKFY